ncbi:hypothetical protein ACA910_004910 [Epithemia clementina (nom. ined.)]
MNTIYLCLFSWACNFVSAEIKASSEVGRRLLSKARRVEDGYQYSQANGYVNYFEGGQKSSYGVYYGDNYYGGNNNNNGNSNYGDQQQAEWQWYTNYMMLGSSWLSEYSIKFQGCYETFKWNKEAMDVEDVRVLTRHVVRFRLCPSSSCSTMSANGCNSQFGEYIIDLNSYLEAYVEAKMAFEQWYDFEEADQNDANANGYSVYDEDFDILDYMDCTDSGLAMEVDEYAQAYYENDGYETTNYYIGPYCAEQGGAIMMGMFKDDACSIPADTYGGKNTYYELTGNYLPFSDRTMIEFDCFSCKQPDGYYNQYNNNNNGNNQNNNGQQENVIQDFCETAYLKSGKCEANLPSSYFNMFKQKNNKACNYIEGIKMIRADGSIVTTHKDSPGHLNSKTAGAFLMAFFGCTVVGLAGYVYTLKTKFDRASIDLS